MRYTLVLFLSIVQFIVKGQENIPIDTWRSHFSYNKVLQVYAFDERVYAVSENGLFYYDKSDGSVNTISKMDGLSEDNISALGYDTSNELLLIGYASGNLEVLNQNEIIFFDLNSNSQVLGSKRVNHFYVSNNRAYVSTDYGLLNFDLSKLEVAETYRQLGAGAEQIKVNQSVTFGDSLYLATEKGILSANLTNGSNLLDPVSYSRTLENQNIDFITNYNNGIMSAVNNEGLYTYTNGDWIQMPVYSNREILSLRTESSDIVIVGNNRVYTINQNLKLDSISSSLINVPSQADIFQGDLFIGDNENGLVTDISGEITNILPSGPNTNSAWSFFTREDELLVSSGGFNSSDLPQGNNFGYNNFKNGQWQSNPIDSFYDITDITYFDDTQAYYLASYGFGVLRIFPSGETELFNDLNATLTKVSADDNSIYITSLAKSNEGLWVANYGGTQGLHLFNGNTWQSISLPTSRIIKLVNSTNYIWMIVDPNYGGGILVYDKSTGEIRYLTDASGNGGLPSKTVNTLAIDNEGLVWVGTDGGISTLSQNQNLITGTVDAVVPIFENRLLLRNEQILSIKVDAGNRKWIGTNNGVWLFDKNVSYQLNYFNTENSPLPSNAINQIDIIPFTGEVFFGTPEGIVSYRAEATDVIDANDNVKIFPNPITSDYTGAVGISGLAENVIVKITDASGRLVWNTRSVGGTATWDALDYNGRRAATGIYFVFSAGDDGEETFVGKIAVVN